MTWRPAKALSVLRDEVNERWPDRSKVSDGLLGDPAHASRVSDHNPNAAGVVRAFDCTGEGNDIEGTNVPGAWLAEHVRQLGAEGFPPLQNHGYVIHAGRAAYASTGWVWQPYRGSSPHTHHVHISVGRNPAQYDCSAPWGIAAASQPKEPEDMPLSNEDIIKIAAAVDAVLQDDFDQVENNTASRLRGVRDRVLKAIDALPSD